MPSADPSSRTVVARIRLPDVEGLYPGMFGRLFIPVRETAALVIPRDAVIRVGQLTMVDVISKNNLKRRSIQIGERWGDQVEVLSGLSEGEQVAVCPSPGHAMVTGQSLGRVGEGEGEKP